MGRGSCGQARQRAAPLRFRPSGDRAAFRDLVKGPGRRSEQIVSPHAEASINLDHLDSGSAADKEGAMRQRSFDVVRLELEIESPRRRAFANLLKMVTIDGGKGAVAAVESQAGSFDSRCKVNFDEFRDYLRPNGQVAQLQVDTLRIGSAYRRWVE